MAKEDNKTTKTLITFAVLFILGAVLIAVIADQTLINTEKDSVADETYNLSSRGCYVSETVNTSDSDCNITVTYAPTGWEQEDTDCYLSGVVLTNSTGTVLTADTDYKVFSSTGIIQMLNTTSTTATALGGGGITLVDYSYCGDGYLADSWGRSVLNVNVGLFAVVLLIGAAALVYYLFGKDRDYD